MKKLLNTLYVTSENSYLSLDGETIVVLDNELEVGRVPLHNLEGIVSFGYRGTSPALMGACAERNISLCYLSPQGKFLARVTGPVKGNVLLRKKQYEVSVDLENSLEIARSCIIGKIYNARWVLERATRDHSLQVDVERIKKASLLLKESVGRIQGSQSKEQLRGYEGEAASIYFSVFDELILQQKKEFFFHGRNKRPPQDNVNALLSFMYTLLTNNIAAALEIAGLDPYVGVAAYGASGKSFSGFRFGGGAAFCDGRAFCLDFGKQKNSERQRFCEKRKWSCFDDGRRAQEDPDGMAEPKEGDAGASIFERENGVGDGAIYSSNAAESVFERRPRRISAVFVEMREKEDAGSDYV